MQTICCSISSTTTIILYVVRLASRVDNFVTFLLAYDSEQHDSIRGQPYRQLQLGPGVGEKLETFRKELHRLLWGELRSILLRWYHKLVREGEEDDDDDVADDRASRMCSLHAHLLLMLRNARPAELEAPLVQTIVCGMVFLSTRHMWNHEQLADDRVGRLHQRSGERVRQGVQLPTQDAQHSPTGIGLPDGVGVCGRPERGREHCDLRGGKG